MASRIAFQVGGILVQFVWNPFKKWILWNWIPPYMGVGEDAAHICGKDDPLSRFWGRHLIRSSNLS
jgi:hypothetical protein